MEKVNPKEDFKVKYISGAFSTCSRKDLVAVSKVLKDSLSTKGLEATISKLENYCEKGIYIPYFKNKTGLSHHGKIASARRPIKSYKYAIDFLKGTRSAIKDVLTTQKEENRIYHSVLVNTSTKRYSKGVIRHARGRAYRKDSALHKLVLELKIR